MAVAAAAAAAPLRQVYQQLQQVVLLLLLLLLPPPVPSKRGACLGMSSTPTLSRPYQHCLPRRKSGLPVDVVQGWLKQLLSNKM